MKSGKGRSSNGVKKKRQKATHAEKMHQKQTMALSPPRIHGVGTLTRNLNTRKMTRMTRREAAKNLKKGKRKKLLKLQNNEEKKKKLREVYPRSATVT
jgi:hypothetical protein